MKTYWGTLLHRTLGRFWFPWVSAKCDFFSRFAHFISCPFSIINLSHEHGYMSPANPDKLLSLVENSIGDSWHGKHAWRRPQRDHKIQASWLYKGSGVGLEYLAAPGKLSLCICFPTVGSANIYSGPQLGNQNLKTFTNFQWRFIINIKQPPAIPSATGLDFPGTCHVTFGRSESSCQSSLKFYLTYLPLLEFRVQ